MSEKDRKLSSQTDDIKEMIELLEQLDYGDKRELRGIMVGLTMKAQKTPAEPVVA